MSCDPVTTHPPQRFGALIKPEQVSRVTLHQKSFSVTSTSTTCCPFLRLQVEAETQLIHQIKRSLFTQHFFTQSIHGAVPVRLFEGIKETKILSEPCRTQTGRPAACSAHSLSRAPPHPTKAYCWYPARTCRATGELLLCERNFIAVRPTGVQLRLGGAAESRRYDIKYV